jgi:hypothetical protein
VFVSAHFYTMSIKNSSEKSNFRDGWFLGTNYQTLPHKWQLFIATGCLTATIARHHTFCTTIPHLSQIDTFAKLFPKGSTNSSPIIPWHNLAVYPKRAWIAAVARKPAASKLSSNNSGSPSFVLLLGPSSYICLRSLFLF